MSSFTYDLLKVTGGYDLEQRGEMEFKVCMHKKLKQYTAKYAQYKMLGAWFS